MDWLHHSVEDGQTELLVRAGLDQVVLPRQSHVVGRVEVGFVLRDRHQQQESLVLFEHQTGEGLRAAHFSLEILHHQVRNLVVGERSRDPAFHVFPVLGEVATQLDSFTVVHERSLGLVYRRTSFVVDRNLLRPRVFIRLLLRQN